MELILAFTFALLTVHAANGAVISGVDNMSPEVALVQRALDKLTMLRSDLGKLEDKVATLAKEEEDGEAAQDSFTNVATLRHEADQRDSFLFSAYKTSNFNGQGFITNWIEEYDQVILNGDSNFNPTTGTYTVPSTDTLGVPQTWYVLFSACVQCNFNSACEVTFRMNQNTRVAAFANRDNKDSHRDQRAQMCNAFIMEMPNSSTMRLYEEAGGGSPNNQKFDNANRFSRFNGFLVSDNANTL